ncbi:glycosyltransferase family 4 protein [Formosa sp. A9]|uniref:glycosyltransferase family 4 protein n=1 Tax=Formosa sp. A9 TaxID=3442641 RepID=UPI003EBD1E17
MKSNKAKVLIFIDWFLPGTRSGGPVRSYANLITHFENEFEFYIVTRDTDYCETQPYTSIKSNTWNQWSKNTKVYYVSNDQLNKETIKKVIASTNFDYGYVNGIYSLYFSILPLFYLKKTNKPVIVAARGMLNPQAFSVKKHRKQLFLKLAKVLGLYKNITFHATNLTEADYIKTITGQSQVKIAANLPRILSETVKERYKVSGEVSMVSIARISKEKGTHHILNALKYVQNKKIQLDLYGPIYDSEYWESCLGIINSLPSTINVQHKGVIDGENIPETLKAYEFLVLLSEGENFGHAILEGLSAGCPVLISDQTPWQQLEDKQIGWDVALTNPEQIQNALNYAINMDAEEYKKWSFNAFRYAKAFCDNPEVLEANRQLFK